MNESWSRRKFAARLTLAAAGVQLNAQSESAPGIGFIGLGIRSKAHFAALKQLPGVHVVAVCDIEPARLEEVSKELPSKPASYTDYRALLRDRNAAAVVIATPNYLHYEMAIAALRAGKEVLLETPAAINYPQAKELRAEAQRSGRVLAIALERLYGSDSLLIQRVARGEVGDVKVIHAGQYRGDWDPRTSLFTDPVTGKTAIWRNVKRAVGSSELECCLPLHAALAMIIDSPLARLTATGGTFYYKNRDTRDASSTIVEFGNGVRLSFDFAMFSPAPSFVNIFGDKGALSRVQAKIALFAQDGTPREMAPMKGPAEQEAMMDLYNDFFDCILTRGTPIASLDLVLEASQIAFGVDQSISTGRTIPASDFL